MEKEETHHTQNGRRSNSKAVDLGVASVTNNMGGETCEIFEDAIHMAVNKTCLVICQRWASCANARAKYTRKKKRRLMVLYIQTLFSLLDQQMKNLCEAVNVERVQQQMHLISSTAPSKVLTAAITTVTTLGIGT
eukprot:15210463-Ditylum_brightwellii.AAC.1